MIIRELKELLEKLPDEMAVAIEGPKFWTSIINADNCRVVSYGKNEQVKIFEIKCEGTL